MPDYPYPGRAISPAYLRKGEGWATPPDQGIDHTAGLSKQGLDNAAPGVISAYNVSGVTTTAATVNWTTASLPGGSVILQRPDGGETIFNEAATPVTAHAAAFTGLTSGYRYSYRIIQPAATFNTPPYIYQSGSFTTL